MCTLASLTASIQSCCSSCSSTCGKNCSDAQSLRVKCMPVQKHQSHMLRRAYGHYAQPLYIKSFCISKVADITSVLHYHESTLIFADQRYQDKLIHNLRHAYKCTVCLPTDKHWHLLSNTTPSVPHKRAGQATETATHLL